MQIAIVLSLLVLAIVLFATEKFSVDIVTLFLLMVLVGAGILTPAEAFAGFSNDIIIILASIFILTGALLRTGVMDGVGKHLYRLAGGGGNGLLLAVMGLVGFASAFMNNTTATAVFVPPVMGVAKQSKVSASTLLMPVAFASILGGTCTLIGTSTNVAVSGYIAKLGMKPLSLFEITPIGLMILLTGIVYMVLVGKRLLPDHKDDSLTAEYAMREYLSEIIVLPGSHMIGQRIFESDLSKMEFRILEVLRRDQKFLPTSRTIIEGGDVLLVEGKVEDLIKVTDTAGIEIRAQAKLSDSDLMSDDITIVELLVTPQSELIGQTLKEANFRMRYGMTALAVNRHGHRLRDKIGRIPLRMGDLLLVQGASERLEEIRHHPDLWILKELGPTMIKRSKGVYAVGFFAAAIVVGGLGWVPLSIAFLGAAILVVLFRCIKIEEAYKEFIDWRLIVLIGGMTAFGTAMDKTGAAKFLAEWIVYSLEPFGVMSILGGLFVLTVILTQPMSNAAAALVVLPIAVETAQRLAVNPRSFAIGVMLAASVSLITPFEPSCILVYGPGKYRFTDFAKTGGLLTIILTVLVLLMLPTFWPLHQ